MAPSESSASRSVPLDARGWLVHIGAGASSVGLLKGARDLGYRTLVFDRDPQAPGVRWATRFEQRGRDEAKAIVRDVEALAERESLVGVATSSAAPACLRIAAEIGARRALPGPTADQIETLLARAQWKSRLARAGVATPASVLTDDITRLREFLDEHPQAILKPSAGSSGSRGVARIDAAEPGLESCFEAARAASLNGEVLAETFERGDEYSVDGFVFRGEFNVLQISRKRAGHVSGRTLPFGYAWGAPRGGARADAAPSWELCRSVGSEVVCALGLEHGLLSLDVLIEGAHASVIDVGPLLDAKVDRGLSFSGIDLGALACELALGRRPSLEYDPGADTRGYGLRFLYAERSGRLGRWSGLADSDSNRSGEGWRRAWPQGAIQDPPRHLIEWERAPGDSVGPPESIADLVGWVLVEAGDAESAWSQVSAFDPAQAFRVVSADESARLEGDGEDMIHGEVEWTPS